ncbi:hypothetical protein [Billgrantia endophytica]|uniref:DUF2489 domain-containing protein n=1 Tax=Billgrantia endophytica TaxID=2033802 RepID=A0A2N7TZI3_9GAMM|nr:hypothetical protein [Halomonas endophytica]PMR73563.1 hypothetical protein C1H69_16695 [Halomonas endophytica]
MNSISPQILGAIIGASISLVAAVIVLIFTNKAHDRRQAAQHAYEQDKENKRHRQAKLEDCYLAFSRWEICFAGIYIGMIGYVKGDFTEERAYEIVKLKTQGGSKEQAEMIINLHFPNLKEKYDATQSARGEIVKYFPPNPKGSGGLKGFYSAQEKFEAAAQQLKEAIRIELENL